MATCIDPVFFTKEKIQKLMEEPSNKKPVQTEEELIEAINLLPKS